MVNFTACFIFYPANTIIGDELCISNLKKRCQKYPVKNSVKALKSMGYITRNFRSKQVDAKLLLESDLILCMTTSHKQYISAFPNVYSIAEYVGTSDVSDPYGMDLNEYVRVSHQIEDACNVILDKILEK